MADAALLISMLRLRDIPRREGNHRTECVNNY
jgi:hypothetical protein